MSIGWFLLGVWCGGCVGFMVAGLCCASSKASEAERRQGHQPTNSTTDASNPPRGGSGIDPPDWPHGWTDEEAA